MKRSRLIFHLSFRIVQLCLFVWLFVKFEFLRFSDQFKHGLFIGTNIRAQCIYLFICGNILQLSHLLFHYIIPGYDKKLNTYLIQVLLSTILCYLSGRLVFTKFWGVPGSDCEYDQEITAPIQLVEGVCIGPDMGNQPQRFELVYDISAIQKIAVADVPKVIEFGRSCMAEQFWLIGQTFLLATAFYQTELLYLNTDMRFNTQLHHYCIIAITLIPFYTDFSTVSITITNIQTFFTSFEHPIYIAMILDKTTEQTYRPLLKRNLYLFSYYFLMCTKLVAHVVSLYMLFKYDTYVNTVTFWVWLFILHFFLYSFLEPMYALRYLIEKKTKILKLK